MKPRPFFANLLIALALLTACASKQPTPQATATIETQISVTASPLPQDRLEAGRIIANLFVQKDFEGVAAYFDATMKDALPVDQLKLVWLSLAQLGEFQSLGEARSERVQEYDVVYIPMQFEKDTVDLKVVFDQNSQIAGLFLAPAQATPSQYDPPAYINPDAFTEQEITVGSGEWALPGTLTLPKGAGPFPAVVLVHGSGPNNRDESIGPNMPFRDLAWGLASQGIAVLRYDKRTHAHQVKFTSDITKNLTVKEEVTDDALLAVALLRQTEGIDAGRIYVLGHSLGGMLIPRIGSLDPEIAGLIVLAGPARPLEDLILEQTRYIAGADGQVTTAEQKSIDEIEAQVMRVKDANLSTDTPAQELPLNISAAYWLDLRGYAPAEAAKALQRPLFILQGERDYQVTVADFELWKAALKEQSDVEFKLYSELNHLFIAGEGPSKPEEYNTPAHVAEEVISDIARWIIGQTQ